MKKIITAIVLAISIVLCCCFSAVALIPENKDDINISIDSIFNPDAPVYSMGISVSKLPNKVKYLVGEEFDSTGIKVVSLLSDGTTEEINSGYTFSGFDSSTIGIKTVTVTYTENATTFTTTFNVYVVVTAEDDSQTTELKWSLKFLNNEEKEITSAKALESFWVSVSLENYEDVFGEMTVGTDYTSSAYENTLNSFLTIFYYDSTKMQLDSVNGIYNPYENLDYDIDFYNSGNRFVYMADANFENIDRTDLINNNGELFRVKFKNINAEYKIPAYISFVSNDASESVVTLLNKPAGEALSASHYSEKQVLGYSQLYGIELGVSKYLSLAGAGVVINRDQLAMEAYVKNGIANEGYDDYFVRFTYKGKTVDVKEYREQDSYFVYKLSGIEPDMFTEPVVMCLYVVNNEDELTNGATYKYSISKYCYDTLGRTNDGKLKTLLVDLLNYGSSVQTYTGNENELANANLTEAQKALGTNMDGLEITDNYDEFNDGNIEPVVEWDSACVDLNDSVDMLFKFNLNNLGNNTENLKLRITVDGKQREYAFDKFVQVENDIYQFKFDKLDITQMRSIVSAQFVQNGQVISNILNYSIESYAAYVSSTSDNEALKGLVRYMLAYGDSVKNYIIG